MATELVLAVYRPRPGWDEGRPRELAGAEVPFARWAVVANL